MRTSSLADNLNAAYMLSELVRTSLGPLSRDKMVVKRSGELMITNDGRTLLEQIFMKHEQESNTLFNPIHVLLVNLSRNQDAHCGDGTTSVVVMCGQMCKNALQLCSCGIDPLLIIEGYKQVLSFALKQLNELKIPQHDHFRRTNLVRAARTSLNTKMVSRDRDRLAHLCVDAALMVTRVHSESKTHDCDLKLIKIDYTDSGSLEDTRLISGIAIMRKTFSHENMPRKITNAKIAVLSCALEPPKPKTRHTVNVDSVESFMKLKQVEKDYFEKTSAILKSSGANVIMCQWSIDHEINDWLSCNDFVAVRWIVGDDIERLAMATGATICARIDQLTAEMLGTAETVSMCNLSVSDKSNTCILVEGCKDPRTCSILVHGTNQYMCEDTIRSLYDALCNVRNSLSGNDVVVGGGAVETELHVMIHDRFIFDFVNNCLSEDKQREMTAFQRDRLYQLINVFKAWADSLLCIPHTLLENAGLPLSAAQQLTRYHRQNDQEAKRYIGIALTNASKSELDLFDDKDDDELMSITDMRNTDVFESIIVKQSILQLATEMTCVILKIDSVITL